MFSDVLPRISVPLFFVISGFLFFYNCDFNSDSYLRKIKTRVRTLLVPYLLWNIIAIAFVICRCTVLKEAYEINISLGRILNTFFNNGNNNGIIIQQLTTVKEMPEPICGVLWYVREIMLMALITPVIYWLIKRCRIWIVIVLSVVWIFDSVLLPTSMHFFISALFFYTAGAYFSVNRLNMVASLCKMKYLPLLYLVIAIIDTTTKGASYNIFMHNIGAIIGLISAFILVSYVIDKDKTTVNKTMANGSFFVYVLHSFILVPIGKGVFMFTHIPDNPYAMLLFYFFVPCLVAFLCYTIYLILKKYMPIVCSVLTGGR